MKRPSGRRLYVGILGLALGGLAVDRLLLSEPVTGPQPASAASPAELSEAAVTPTAPAPRAAPPRGEEALVDLARRLRALERTTAPDAGSDSLANLVECFVTVHERGAGKVPEVAPVVLSEPPRVSAVLVGPRPAAIAGGRSVALGATLDGWTVLEIGPSSVIFGRDGVRAERRVR